MTLLSFTAIAISVNFTNYGALIPTLQRELAIGGGGVALLSTVLYVGIGCTYLAGGMLADRLGSERVLAGALALVGGGGALLAVDHSLGWLLGWRALIGAGSGAAIVAASQYAGGMGRSAGLGQGLFGGAMQLGAGCGLFLTPLLSDLTGAWATFPLWGSIGLITALVWLRMARHTGQVHREPTRRRFGAGFQMPSLRRLGIIQLGTLGIGQATAPWLAVYCATRFDLPVAQAAALGSCGLFAGMLFRPLGGILATCGVDPYLLMRLGTGLACGGLIALAVPGEPWPIAVAGLGLLAVGTTLPYAAVFTEAGAVGTRAKLGRGTAQGVVSTWSAPASAFGPPLIGAVADGEGSFRPAFAVLAGVAAVAFATALALTRAKAAASPTRSDGLAPRPRPTRPPATTRG